MHECSVADEMAFSALPLETRQLAFRIVAQRLRPDDHPEEYRIAVDVVHEEFSDKYALDYPVI